MTESTLKRWCEAHAKPHVRDRVREWWDRKTEYHKTEGRRTRSWSLGRKPGSSHRAAKTREQGPSQRDSTLLVTRHAVPRNSKRRHTDGMFHRNPNFTEDEDGEGELYIKLSNVSTTIILLRRNAECPIYTHIYMMHIYNSWIVYWRLPHQEVKTHRSLHTYSWIKGGFPMKQLNIPWKCDAKSSTFPWTYNAMNTDIVDCETCKYY